MCIRDRQLLRPTSVGDDDSVFIRNNNVDVRTTANNQQRCRAARGWSELAQTGQTFVCVRVHKENNRQTDMT